MNKLASALILIMVITTGVSIAQLSKEKQEVMAQIEYLFDGMRAGDSAMVSSVFHPDVVMRSIGKNRAGNIQLFEGALERFLQAVGTPHNDVWDERTGQTIIQVDGNMAHAWVPYSFYLGDNFSHCGVNSFQFFKTNGEWKVISIVDTRRPDKCVEDL